MKNDAVEASITRVLETQPEVRVPEDFAARVRLALPVQRRAAPRRSASSAAGMGALVLLLTALCWLAPHVRPSFESIAFDLEMVLTLELALVAVWLAASENGA